MADGFISPESPEVAVEEELRALTIQAGELPPITRGRYTLEEDDLPESLKELLHGRIFVIDREIITATNSNEAVTYYIAADKVQGLVVPARYISIDSEAYDIHYRHTDDGERWSNWITLPAYKTDSSSPLEKCRFAEIQVYTDTSGARVSIRATR